MSTAEFANSLGKLFMQYLGLFFSSPAGHHRLIAEGAQIIPDETPIGPCTFIDSDCFWVQEQMKHDKWKVPAFICPYSLTFKTERACMAVIGKRSYCAFNSLTDYEVWEIAIKDYRMEGIPSKDFLFGPRSAIGKNDAKVNCSRRCLAGSECAHSFLLFVVFLVEPYWAASCCVFSSASRYAVELVLFQPWNLPKKTLQPEFKAPSLRRQQFLCSLHAEENSCSCRHFR